MNINITIFFIIWFCVNCIFYIRTCIDFVYNYRFVFFCLFFCFFNILFFSVLLLIEFNIFCCKIGRRKKAITCVFLPFFYLFFYALPSFVFTVLWWWWRWCNFCFASCFLSTTCLWLTRQKSFIFTKLWQISHTTTHDIHFHTHSFDFFFVVVSTMCHVVT